MSGHDKGKAVWVLRADGKVILFTDTSSELLKEIQDDLERDFTVFVAPNHTEYFESERGSRLRFAPRVEGGALVVTVGSDSDAVAMFGPNAWERFVSGQIDLVLRSAATADNDE